MWRLVVFTSFAIGVDIEKTEDAVIAYGNARNANKLLEEVEGVNKEKMKKFIFNSNDGYEIYNFVRNLMWKKQLINMNDMLEAKQLVKDSKDIQTIRFWAKEIGDVEEMQDITIKYGNAWDMYSFAKEVKDANIVKIRVEIAKKNCKEVMQRFNSEFPNPIIKKSFFDRFKK